MWTLQTKLDHIQRSAISTAEPNKEACQRTSLTVNPCIQRYTEICLPKLEMASCLAVLGDSDVMSLMLHRDAGCRREEELLFLSSGLVSLPSLIFLRIPQPLVEMSCTVSRKSRHPRHISIKTIRVQCFVTVKGSQTITRMFHSCRKPHLALSEPNTPHQAPAFSCRTNIKA